MNSLRPRIALAVALVAAFAAAFVGVVVNHQAGVDARERLREQAAERVAAAVTAYSIDGLLRYSASTDPNRGPRALRAASRQNQVVTYFDGDSMWASQYLHQTRFTVQLSAGELQASRVRLRNDLILAGLVAVLLSSLLGWVVAGRLTHRLRMSAAGVRALANGETTEPISGNDEVGTLWSAVADLAEQLRQRVQREKEFSADVAHELRTPLTALVSASELLPEGQAADLVRSQVGRMRRLVEDLLEISRLENTSVQSVLEQAELAQVVEQIAGAENLVVSVVDSQRVWLDPRRLERVLLNLISNARRHGGAEPTLTVQANTVTIRDQGPGFSEELLSAGPQRFRASGANKGAGLGLTIALRQAAAMGARVQFSNHAGGAQATIVLRPADEGTA